MTTRFFRLADRRWCVAWLSCLVGFALHGSGRAASAQIPATLDTAITLTAAALSQHLATLAHDSLHSRGTPSPELERVTQYVADQFAQAGLSAGNRAIWSGFGDTTWIQRYALPGQTRLDPAASTAYFGTSPVHRGQPILTEEGRVVSRARQLPFSTGVRVLSPSVPEGTHGDGATVTLVMGRQPLAALQRLSLQRKVVLYVPFVGAEASEEAAVRAYLARTSQQLVVLSPVDSARFAAQLAADRAHPLALTPRHLQEDSRTAPGPWVIEVRLAVVRELLITAGAHLPQSPADTTPRVQELPALRMSFGARPEADSLAPRVTAPIVMGTVEGRDTALAEQYVVVLAPIDPLASTGDSLSPSSPSAVPRLAAGAPIAGLLELARALQQPGMRPRRSVVFVAVSGERQGAWGGRFFQSLVASRRRYPMLVLTLGVNERLTGDSVGVAGLAEVAFAQSPTWVLAAHPELGLAMQEPRTVFHPDIGSAAVFAQQTVPSVVFESGRLALESKEAGPNSVETERLARYLRLVFYVLQDIANAQQPPRWTAAGRGQSVGRNP